MYCKSCGREIADDSKFCQFCGQNIKNKNINVTPSVSKIKSDPLVDKYVNQERTKLGLEPEATYEPAKSHSCLAVVIAFAILIIVCACVAVPIILMRQDDSPNAGGGSENSTPQLFSRQATNNDIAMELDQDFSLNVKIKVTTLQEIKNLTIEFKFYDKNNELLTTKTRNYSVTAAGMTYEVIISLTDFSFGQIMKIHHVSAGVTGGTVSYFK